MRSNTEYQWLETQFMESVQALAMPFEIQVRIFPSGVCLPCELTFDFIHFSEAYVGNNRAVLTESQRSCVQKLVDTVSKLSQKAEHECWNNEPLKNSLTWEEIRTQSAIVLNEFGWTVKEPSSR